MKKTQKDDGIRILAGIGIYPEEVKKLTPAEGWKKIIEMTGELKNLLGEIGIPTETFQKLPVTILKKTTEYRTDPLVLK